MFTIPICRDFTQFIFSGKNYFDATWFIIGTSKYLAKKKKTIIVRNKNLVWCLLDWLFCLLKLLLLLLPWWLRPPPSPPHSSVDHGQHAGHRPELYASLYASLPYYFTARYFTPVMPDWGTNPARGLFFARFEYIRDSPTPRQSGITALRTTNAESEKIATLEVKYRTSRTNFTHRFS